LVNLEATGNQGLVASHKVELQRKSVMLYHFLVNLLKTTKMTRYCIDQEMYTYIQEGELTIKHFCSLNLWAMMRKEIWPQTKVSTKDLETKLSEITFAACNTSIPTLITKMLDIKCQIKAEKQVLSLHDATLLRVVNNRNGAHRATKVNGEWWCVKGMQLGNLVGGINDHLDLGDEW
jgi:hypothetical protein